MHAPRLWALVVAFVLGAGAAPAQPGPAFDLAYLENDGTTARVVCLDIATGAGRTLASGDSSVYGPRWVPALGRVVVASLARDPAVLLALDPGGAAPDTLGPNPAADEVPTWAPDLAFVVYSEPTETGRALVRAAPGGEVLERLTPGESTDKQPTLSPDGLRVAFVSDRAGNDDVWVLDLVSGAFHNATASPAAEGHPAWAPDGQGLVFYRFENGDADLYTLALGAEPAPLAPSPGFDLVARVSPDGAWVAFGSARSDDWDVYLVRRDGTELRRVTDRPGFDGDAVWLPRGACR